MRLSVVLALLLASTAAAKSGRYAELPPRLARQEPTLYTECSELPDPSVSTTALTTATSASDLHADIMAACGSGCIVTLAPGTYDGNIVFGDSGLKAGSITPTGEVLIRGTDRDNPPVIRATLNLRAAVVHAKDVTARIRLEDVILDGRRSEQTASVLTTVCADTTPADGICDSGASNGFASGFHTRSTLSGTTSSCLLRIEVRDTVNNGIVIAYGSASTVQDSYVHDIGCTTTTCPSLSIPATSNVNSQIIQAMGVQFNDSISGAVVRSTIHDVTKIGIECFLRAYQCQFVGNTIYDAYNAGISFSGGDGRATDNTIFSIGFDHAPNLTTDNLGHGILFVADIDYPPLNRTYITANRISSVWSSGIQIGVPAGVMPPSPMLSTLSGNIISGACDGTTRADVAAYELGDSTAVIQDIRAYDNVATGVSRCPQVFEIRNLLHYTERRNSVTGSTGGNAVEYDDVEQLDSRYLTVSDDINIDADSTGRLHDCTLGSGAAVTGTTSGPVRRANCGA